MARVQQLAPDLFLIDTEYDGARDAIGVYLLTGDRPALIETGPAARVETVLDGIRGAGLDPAALQAVAVTHIHLDHAAATGALVRRYPNLEVYVHPIGAAHLADPTRLLASAGRLYGDDLGRLFGEVLPVPADRLRTLADGARVRLGSRVLTALDTPGHARHHLAYHNEASGDVFTGDAAGVALPGARYVRPPTPPPEIDLPAWDATIARLRALHPRRLLLTHFGPHEWADALFTQLHDRLHALAGVVEAALADGLDDDAVVQRVRRWLLDDVRSHQGAGADAAAGRFEVIMSTRLSVLGLIRYVRSR
jgi:glyoxylase-like metal-dependent hydrolase (beta-lactamase superfamily II)